MTVAESMLRALLAGVCIGALVWISNLLLGPVTLDPVASGLIAASGYVFGQIGLTDA